ncbi:MAG: hypothetical protein LBD70_02665 [Bifidobacteriaceae bacterium]|nr:hypothetical protein [Bifidobacteriaceae bacterium]
MPKPQRSAVESPKIAGGLGRALAAAGLAVALTASVLGFAVAAGLESEDLTARQRAPQAGAGATSEAWPAAPTTPATPATPARPAPPRSAGSSDPPSPASSAASEPGAAAPALNTPQLDPASALQAELTATVAALEAETGTSLGVALLAAGGDAASTISAGSWVSGRAWSTIKVPIAIAALEAGGSDAAAVLAITQSDNAAARELWNSIGAAEAAGAATDAVLRAGGDSATAVQRLPFGYTVWDLTAQAGFAAHFPAGAAADRVWDLMGQIDSSQRWGLGRLDAARFKGGWSPDDAGYTVRQFGQAPLANGCVAVAIAADASSFEAGAAALDRLADRLAALAEVLPTGPCR